METMKFEKSKVRLPSGKEVSVSEALKFCYDLSDTDIQVLQVLSKTEYKSEDEISNSLKLSKASVNRSLNKLLSTGFCDRMKDQNSKGGRPRYLYKALSTEMFIEKITRDLNSCADIFSHALPQLIGS
ncbi:TrmB family transcriptional regulator [Sulfolobales archaeon HS-7]|nr:TrmB family transcriptional regulator [Sulfolobales archaeon HS-7]